MNKKIAVALGLLVFVELVSASEYNLEMPIYDYNYQVSKKDGNSENTILSIEEAGKLGYTNSTLTIEDVAIPTAYYTYSAGYTTFSDDNGQSANSFLMYITHDNQFTVLYSSTECGELKYSSRGIPLKSAVSAITDAGCDFQLSIRLENDN